MKLKEKTKFIFILTSSTKVEDRFLYDAELCLRILTLKGVNLSDVIIATDADENMVLAKCSTMQGATFINSQQLLNTINTLKCPNLIILTDCHGSIRGIDAKHPIMPYPLTEAIKMNRTLKNVIVFFGQCYAGIYNWVDITTPHKNIVYIGATGFDSSLSYGMDQIPWSANISLVALGQWLHSPVDIDGDGSLTVMDLFKYIAWFTNSVTDNIEKKQTSDLVDAKVDLKLAMKESEKSTDMKAKLEQEAIEALGNYIVPHQTPWILNAKCAQKIHFD